jgi:predicted  nucleic acid-binding Zn-ribbon protein
LEHEAAAKIPIPEAPKVKKEKPKGGTKESEKRIRRLEREIEKQEALIAELEAKMDASGSDYQEYSRLLEEKDAAETVLLELMEAWEAEQE